MSKSQFEEQFEFEEIRKEVELLGIGQAHMYSEKYPDVLALTLLGEIDYRKNLVIDKLIRITNALLYGSEEIDDE